MRNYCTRERPNISNAVGKKNIHKSFYLFILSIILEHKKNTINFNLNLKHKTNVVYNQTRCL